MKNNIKIFGIKISARSMDETVGWIKEKINSKKGGVIYCATMNEIQMCENNSLIKKMFEKADLITADGMPLVWGIRYKIGKGERVYGPDLMNKLIYGNKNRHIFVGNIKNKNYFKKIGSYVVMPMKDKFTEGDYKNLFEKINKLSGKIVWLGLGSRKQVEVAYELKKRGIKKIIITVGAAFDFLSGNIKQAPKWLRNIGGEWIFRLINEPKRLWPRYIQIIKFLVNKIRVNRFDFPHHV